MGIACIAPLTVTSKLTFGRASDTKERNFYLAYLNVQVPEPDIELDIEHGLPLSLRPNTAA